MIATFFRQKWECGYQLQSQNETKQKQRRKQMAIRPNLKNLPPAKKPTEQDLKRINPKSNQMDYDNDDDYNEMDGLIPPRPTPIQDLPSRQELMEELETIKKAMAKRPKQKEAEQEIELEEQQDQDTDDEEDYDGDDDEENEPEPIVVKKKGRPPKNPPEEESPQENEITGLQRDYVRQQYVDAVEERLFEAITLLKKLKQIKEG